MRLRHELTDIFPDGTSLKGHVTTTFDDLVEAFGYPNMINDKTGPGDKTWWEWCVEFYDPKEDEYHIAFIYDWKEIGPASARTGKYRWHIGGKKIDSVWCVMDVLSYIHPVPADPQ